MLENRIDFYREWCKRDKGKSPVLFPPDLSQSSISYGRLYRQLWYTFEGGARYFEKSLKKGWLKTPRRWRILLSLAFAEIIWDQQEKHYASVNEWVEIAKKETGNISSKVINGNLRTLLREIDSKSFTLQMALPDSLIKQWESNRLEPSQMVEVLRKGNFLHWHFLKNTDMLQEEECQLIEWENIKCFQLNQGLSPNHFLKGENLGFFQNINAAKIAANVINSTDINTPILDLCSAPGGKSWQMAKLQPLKNIHMHEVNPKRAKLIVENKIFTSYENISFIDEDVLKKRNYSEILIDVPCSNSGVLAKNPEAIKHFWTPEDSFKDIQHQIFDFACEILNSSGSLFYSTCSINARENDFRIQEFLNKTNSQLIFEKKYYPDIHGEHGGYLAQIKM